MCLTEVNVDRSKPCSGAEDAPLLTSYLLFYLFGSSVKSSDLSWFCPSGSDCTQTALRTRCSDLSTLKKKRKRKKFNRFKALRLTGDVLRFLLHWLAAGFFAAFVSLQLI